ncbi:SIR2 family protein [Methyloglobulus sp.]|uniref:SIR2 family protein n=1 Tax=Methyloglobulus sp. TaxID=2518622 RepID=UPI0032B76E99
MALTAAPIASTISVRATLDMLDGPFSAMAEGISQDLYALWLGSGISFGRVPGLQQVVKRVLQFLQEQVVPGDPNCRFRKALVTVLGLANPSADEITRTDMERPVEDWPDLFAFTGRLVNSYARMLDVSVDGEDSDFLLWAGIDVPETYANPSTTPDAEHLCLALLVAEGVASDIASANWDDLVEKAVSELGNGAALSVLVRSEDTRGVQERSRLYKFHGCAVRAGRDATNYRNKLVARQSQINGWAYALENAIIVDRLVLLATTKRTLMVGLSAQDSNIQGVFAKAQTRMEWPWPSPELACVFSANELGIDHLGLLQNVYQGAFSAASKNSICEEALFRAYAKPLLIAIVLHVLFTKLSALASIAPGVLNEVGRKEIGAGIVALRNVVGELVEGVGHELFVRELVAQSARALSLFRDGRVPALGSHSYYPLSRENVNTTMNDPTLPASGLREMAVGVGLVGMGLRAGQWSLKSTDRADIKSGTLCIKTAAHAAHLFFVANTHTALCLHYNGHVTADDNAVIVHSLEIPPMLTRSPCSAPGRTGKMVLREVSITELMGESEDVAALFKRFREETAL